MTRKKQIIEILEKYSVKRVYFNSDDSICAERINVRDEVVDAILALPLDVPNSDEILSLAKKKGYYGNVPDAEINAFLKGALAVIIEIIKRNK
jgi:hypothetical protein